MTRLRLFNAPSIFSSYEQNLLMAPKSCLDAKHMVKIVSLRGNCDSPIQVLVITSGSLALRVYQDYQEILLKF